MNDTVEKIKDAVMVIGGLSYYVAGTYYLVSKLATHYSVTLM